ncbi:glycyl radical enzyme domain-containing protein, partial [Salmonella enterica]|uniref:glycyl radical enzyme domain-containing protein n=1 Tax=Salmonella enterica TaxID=28901 RepID=UPI00398C59CD
LCAAVSTLLRLKLKAGAERSTSCDYFLSRPLPYSCRQQITTINSRCEFLTDKSHYFDIGFLVLEGLFVPERFVLIFGMSGPAEAVQLLYANAALTARCEKKDRAKALSYLITGRVEDFVPNQQTKYGLSTLARLHA